MPAVSQEPIVKKKRKSVSKLNSEESVIGKNEQEETVGEKKNGTAATKKLSERAMRSIPHNLEEFIKLDSLERDTTKSTFSLEDVTEDDELWLIEIPKKVNPHQLIEQSLCMATGNKTKLKIGKDKYQAVSGDIDVSVTAVVSTGNEFKPYKTAKIRPSGKIIVKSKSVNRRSESESIDKQVEEPEVPFPQHVKIRHPYFIDTKSTSKIKSRSKRRRTSNE